MVENMVDMKTIRHDIHSHEKLVLELSLILDENEELGMLCAMFGSKDSGRNGRNPVEWND